MNWQFMPAAVRRFEDGKTDYPPLTEDRTIAFYIDHRFDFRIVDGKGVVSTR